MRESLPAILLFGSLASLLSRAKRDFLFDVLLLLASFVTKNERDDSIMWTAQISDAYYEWLDLIERRKESSQISQNNIYLAFQSLIKEFAGQIL